MIAALPEEGVLCALVLAPAALSRNRFFTLFAEPRMRRARARARQIRALARQILDARDRVQDLTETQLESGRTVLRFRVPSIGYARVATLEPIEAAALRYALHLASRRERPLAPDDRARVESALASLGPTTAGSTAIAAPPDALEL